MIAQTTDGFLWFASRNGLIRFDGVRFERYESRSGDDIPPTSVRALLALPDNGLLVGWQYGGATLLRDGHATHYGETEGLPPGTVYGFQVDGTGALWAATSSALARFDGKRWQRIGADWNFREKRALSLFVDHEGTLGAFTDSTLLLLPRGARSFQPTGGKVTTRIPIVQSPNGSYFMSDGRGVLPIVGLASYDRSDPAWVASREVHAESNPVLADRDGGLWFGTVHGIGRIADPGREHDKGEAENFGPREGFTDDTVVTLFEDRDGSIWIGTGGGVDRFRSSRFVALPQPDHAAFAAMLARPDGGLRFGGLGRELRERLPDGSSHAIAPLAMRCAYRDADGNEWYASEGDLQKRAQLFKDAGGKFDEVAIPDAVPAAFSIQSIVVDADRSPWISVVRHGLFRLGKDGWTQPDELPEHGKLPAFILVADSRRGVWIGYAGNQIARWQDGKVRVWSASEGVSIGNALAIQATGRHVWIGGEFGLAVLDGDRFRSFELSIPGVLRGITGLVETNDGDLWIHGAGGAVLVDAAEVKRAIEQHDRAARFRVFDSEDGLFGQPTDIRALPTLVAGVDGRLWFATERGIFMLDPARIGINRTPPEIAIDEVIAGEKVFRSPADLALPALTTNLQVRYTAPSLMAPRRVRFHYKLDGVDPEWKEAGSRREAFYTNLGPGSYRFHVSAANEDGVWSEQGASFAFSIAPAWYQARWFYMLCVLIVIAGLAAMYRARVSRVRTQTHARLQARLLERERIARELHDTLIQGFQGLVLTFHAAMRRIPVGHAPREQIEEALARAEEVLAEGRDRVRGLRESAVYQSDLLAAVSDVATDLAATNPTAFQVRTHGTERPLHPVALEEIYGIAREALANAFRHAAASRINVEIAFDADQLRIRIIDDGRGIDAAVLARGGVSGHWGLPGMRERAHKLGARLRMRSGPSAGTEIELEVPAAVAYPSSAELGAWWRRLRRRALMEDDDVE